ncbi:hypothetical protein K439DRAFT_1625439 [Ramaria rubella]|nr:hypothetical protein K439DRAFT_1625439 [Ramaria rubella]
MEYILTALLMQCLLQQRPVMDTSPTPRSSVRPMNRLIKKGTSKCGACDAFDTELELMESEQLWAQQSQAAEEKMAKISLKHCKLELEHEERQQEQEAKLKEQEWAF